MGGKRVNQFNLMLTENELEMLKSQAEERGFVNKSQYLRELMKNDRENKGEDSGEVMRRLEAMVGRVECAVKRWSVMIISLSLIVLLVLAAVIFINM